MKSKYSDWLASNYAAAVKVTEGTGIFPEVLLSQAIIESAKGGKMPGTKLAREYNNYFGIKAQKGYKGKAVNMQTGEYNSDGEHYMTGANFRVYNSPADSFADYVKFLSGKRYKKAREAKSAMAQAAALQAAGYSTAPDYGEKVAALATTIKNAAGALATAVKNNPGKSGAAGLLLVAGAAALYFSQQK